MDVLARGILEVRRVLVAVLLVVGAVCASMPQNPEVVSTYTLESWQNQPGMADQTGHKPVHEGSLIACTNVEPKKDGNECLLKYENDGKMYLEFHQTITATSTDEVFLSCVSKESTEPISCEVTITVLKYKNRA
jgi:predicted SAM-dependent methyltransferase